MTAKKFVFKKGKAATTKKQRKGPSPNAHWIFERDGAAQGPFTDAELCELADGGTLLPSDTVWRDDDPDTRVKAYEVEDLFPDMDGAAMAQEDVPMGIPLEEGPEAAGIPDVIFQTSPSDIGSVTCPYCWFKCEPEDMLYIARHPDLLGDPILGADEAQRFLPSRFTPDGLAIDAEGVACPEQACPRCHMRLPRSLVSMPPLFLSLVGAPASGKSYFLTSMCWQLRRTLVKAFQVRFTDSDGQANHWLNDYEERLFVQPDEESYQAIDKTQLQGDLYREIIYNNMRISLPLPCVFALQADRSSRFHGETGDFINRSLVLYDNAGEHFEPGRDSAQDPGTHHLIHSEALLFSFDPTKDPHFRSLLKERTADLQIRQRTVQRQDTLLAEMIHRVRLYLGLDATHLFSKPVIMMMSKADVLGDLLSGCLHDAPWIWDDNIQSYALDLTRLLQVSFVVRSLIEEQSPETIATVESFATDVLYVPVSALGHSPQRDPSYQGEGDAPLVVRPRDVNPQWVEVPLLYILYRLGFLSGIREELQGRPEPQEYDVRGGTISFTVPGTSKLVRLPQTYAGAELQCPETKVWFRVPEFEE